MKLVLSLLILLIVSVAASAILFNRSNSNALFLSASGPAPGEHGPVRMIRFVLSDGAIYPRELRVAQGLFNISLEDKTKKSEGLVIESVVGNERVRVSKVTRNENQWRGRGLIRLTPGRYLISDASQPDRRAEVTVDQ